MKNKRPTKLQRLQKLLPNYEVFDFRSFPDDGFEFNLRPKKRTYKYASVYMDLKTLQRLADFFDTEQIAITAYDLSDDATDYVIYVLVNAEQAHHS